MEEDLSILDIILHIIIQEHFLNTCQINSGRVQAIVLNMRMLFLPNMLQAHSRAIMQTHRPLPMGHHYMDIPAAQRMVVVNQIMVLLQHIVLVAKLLITLLTLQLKLLWELIRVLCIPQRLQIMV